MADRSPPDSAETKLFGEVPLSDSENASPTNTPTVLTVKAQNDLNTVRNISQKMATNGTVAENGATKNGKTVLDVAVIDIDEGEF